MPLNFTERDIEDWIYDNPDALKLGIVGWIGRQYSLPSGIADLIGYRADLMVIVIEVKNVPINKAALAQVSRYAYDVQHIVNDFADYSWMDGTRPYVQKVLVGPSIDEQTMEEATAMGIDVLLFQAALHIRVSILASTDTVARQASLRSFSDRPEWSVLGRKVWEPQSRSGAGEAVT